MNPNLCEFLGFGYQSLSDDDSFGIVDTPFCFEDEDAIPVYVEKLESTLRFFDDGAILRRLMGRGVPVDNVNDVVFLSALINPCGASLNEAGEIEVCVPQTCAPAGFAQYVSAILALVQWEKDQSAAAAARRSNAESRAAIAEGNEIIERRRARFANADDLVNDLEKNSSK